MPIYEYRCQGCESHFEKMQKVSEAPLETCEKCGGKLEKQWSLSGFQFKGAGWYVTDYSNKGKSETKSDAKTETKGESSNGTEKSSAGESTTKSESASNTTKSDVSTTKKE
jgi:putative FmdB family regulatory protein